MSLIPFNFTDDAGVCIGTDDITMTLSRDEIRVFEYLWLHGKEILHDHAKKASNTEGCRQESVALAIPDLIEEAMFKMTMLFDLWI